MVEAEDTFTAVERWKEVFGQGRVIPPSRHTSRLAGENHLNESRGFELSLSRVTAPHLPQGASESQGVSYQLRASLFDGRHQQFLGRTWRSPPQRLRNNTISFNQVLYFHTVLRLPGLLLVAELVELTVKADSSHQARGRGFALLELFSSTSPSSTSEVTHKLNVHEGSPRSLLHPTLKDTTDYGSVLRAVEGAHLNCVLKSHSPLASALHLFPQNLLLSGDESIPGLLDSPTGGALLKPRLLPSQLFTLGSVTVSLRPSLESFEAQLLQHVNADCIHTKQLGAEELFRTVVIQERRLHVGVHNGWGFLEPPQVVVLEVLPPAGSKDKSSAVQKLGLRSALQLSLMDHPAVAVIFQLEYAFSAPIGQETVLTATATNRAAFLQSLRWGVWNPFSTSSGPREGEVRLLLQGGATPNPFHVMVLRDEAEEVSRERDIVSFHLSSGLERKPSGSKSSVRAQESMARVRRTDMSPARGPRLVSPPDSPQGPGLSLSHQADPERYPTITHFSAASPWQPSSLLHPSPLATAHQLPRAAGSSFSSVAHLEADLAPGPPPDEGPLQELAFTPIHAPVLILGANAPGSSAVSSRRSLARLSSAGFPEVLDCTGRPAEELDPSQPVTFDPQREANDRLQGNQLLLQFLAFTRVPGEGGAPDWPRGVFFTFQLYRFPPLTTQPLTLLSDHARPPASVTDQSESLCLLTTINRDGTTSSANPGLQLQFKVDRSFLGPREQGCFLKYLALHQLHIDVWDSDSLLLLGSTALPLKHMLRQGKPAVQSLHELDVLTTEYLGEGSEGTSVDQGLDCFLTVRTLLRGRLHVRTANIGSACRPDQQRAADIGPTHVILPPRGFRGGSLAPQNILQINARNSAQADWPSRADLKKAEETEERRRKLSCMAAVRQKEGAQHGLMPKLAEPPMRAFSPGPGQMKAEAIAHMLRQAITQQHLLFSTLGSAQYLEFVLRNPVNTAHTVTVCSDHPDLSVITSAEEWHYFKSFTPSATAVEENMFHLEPGAPGPQVYLRPKETLHIPLKYQSFHCHHSSVPHGPSLVPAGAGPGTAQRNAPQTAAPTTIKVSFNAEDGKPLSILQVSVQPIPHMVDQTFRLYHPEQSFLKKAIRLPPLDQSSGAEAGEQMQVTVRCTDPDVICQTRKTVPGEPQDVYLRVPGSPSPHVRVFSIMVYMDKWMAAPSHVWQVYVHFLERLDMSVVVGQRSCQSLVLRGTRTMRKLRCYSSHPRDLQVEPEGVFALPPAGLQEVQVRVQPWRTGRRFFYVSAVDVEQQRLVSSWLLCLSVHRPVISKAFEVSVPVGEGRGSSRKISYTNPYSGPRTLLLRSDHPHLLLFREERFQVDGGETYTIGLRFAPSRSPGAVEILVFVNDQEEKTEETFCVRVCYS